MANEPGEVEVMVAVADDHLERFAEVAQRLRAAGMRVTGEQASLGTVTGRIDAGRVDQLHGVAGVGAVERAGGFQLPPPESDLQ